MPDTKNFAIGILSTTAVMLLVGLVIVQSRPAATYGDGMTLVSGDYVLTIGGLNQTDEDYLYVVDNAQARMIVYRFDGFQGRIEIVDGVDLDEVRKSAEPQGSAPPGRPRRP